jgi:hypothetical protein
MVMRFALFCLSVALLIAISAKDTAALEFSSHPNDKPSLLAILAEGEIRVGDVERLQRFLSKQPQKQRAAIYLASPGGALYEGMRLGLLFSIYGIQTVVEGGRDCASACALAFLGGTDRDGAPWRSASDDSRLGFHSFSSGEDGLAYESDVQMVVADVLKYTKMVDAPLELMIMNFSTPSDQMYWLNNEEICSLGIKLWSNLEDRFLC